MDAHYLDLLSRSFPTLASACTEVINLEAILNLPKGTEHFLTDIHGEYEAFDHVLRNASGAVARKVNEEFGKEMREKEIHDFCTLLYYPEERLKIIRATEENIDEWYVLTLIRLVRLCRRVSSKYTRSKVRKALPEDFSYIIHELMHESDDDENKTAYVQSILQSIISIGRADAFIIAMCGVIQRLVIDHLHIVGDIYDRGPGAHLIMDKLSALRDFDIQWGNHDVLWMGAAAGNEACIANVLRVSLRYGNLITLEDGYGINMLPLATFAMQYYENDPCTDFMPKLSFADDKYDERNVRLIAQMHKAISIIQFKLEHQYIARHPEWNMQSRDLLDKIDPEKGTVVVEGVEYKMNDMLFPTIDWNDPYRLTEAELDVMFRLKRSFHDSPKLKSHIKLFLRKGSIYLKMNTNLLFHASIPMTKNGEFVQLTIGDKKLGGKALLDEMDRLIRIACVPCEHLDEYESALDYMWYWWCGPQSPSFDKSKMATFERYFIDDKVPHKEVNGYYYTLRGEDEICEKIFKEFGMEGEQIHIINGHVPVKTIKGEQPVRANGKVFVIDGGFSRAYQKETGIAGYTLVFNSHGLVLVQHEPFESRRAAIEQGVDFKGKRFTIEVEKQRVLVRHTDIGKKLQQQVDELKALIERYRTNIG